MVRINFKIRKCLVFAGVFAVGLFYRIMYVIPSIEVNVEKAKFRLTWVEPPDVVNLRTFGVVRNIPDDKTLSTYGINQLNAIYHSYLDNIDIICHRKLRMGNLGDGGWEICDDYQWRPIRPCIVYSFGINYDFSFDDDAGRIYGCDIYSFDPSMTMMNTSQRSDRVMFYRLGIGGRNRDPQISAHLGWIVHTLSFFRAMLNHTNKIIDVLKIDVESSEWPSLINMLQERQLNDCRQLLIEFHQYTNNPNIVHSRLKIVRHLALLGFRKFYVSKNFLCPMKAKGVPVKRTACYEVHYVNSNLVRNSPGPWRVDS